MLSRLQTLKGKDKVAPVVRPLKLLDLPYDILRDILSYVPHPPLAVFASNMPSCLMPMI